MRRCQRQLGDGSSPSFWGITFAAALGTFFGVGLVALFSRALESK